MRRTYVFILFLYGFSVCFTYDIGILWVEKKMSGFLLFLNFVFNVCVIIIVMVLMYFGC